ncbi:hypothetical protein FQA39_LY16200 [Lamprigera yunnana]|nr:hypothetical protein FQA39_LY16200 [Lamprigera yunnana]
METYSSPPPEPAIPKTTPQEWREWLQIVKTVYQCPNPQLAATNKDHRLYVPVQIEEKTAHALVDRGATQNYIGIPVQEILEEKGVKPLETKSELVRLENGKCIPTKGKYECTIKKAELEQFLDTIREHMKDYSDFDASSDDGCEEEDSDHANTTKEEEYKE